MHASFKVFMLVMFRVLGLADPTDEQCELGDFLQYGGDRTIVEAFRGWGKSQVTALYVLWLLYNDPQKRIMIVSVSAGRAKDMTQYLLKLIREVTFLKFLEPKSDDRQSTEKFDVGPAEPSQSPSVKSVGITGQITGSRAHCVVADDVESPKNSATEIQRQRLAELVKELESVLYPGGKVVYLGTPHCFMSLYNALQSRGFIVRLWPIKYPDPDTLRWYGSRFSPVMREKLDRDPSLVGKPMEPARFNEMFVETKLTGGRTYFSLQYMLCTKSSDEMKFPLRLSDLIVMEINPELAPEKPVWSTDPTLAIDDLPNVGMDGDRYYRPMRIQGDFKPYSKRTMVIDPSGRGKDETTYCIGGVLNGYVYLLEQCGYLGGYTDETLEALAIAASRCKVHEVIIESNYGDGMFTKIIKPFFDRIYPVSIVELKVKGQKEARIIDTLEPILNQHRLVVSPSLIRKDYESVQSRDEDVANAYMLFSQVVQITREPGALVHDDRIDALSTLVESFHSHLGRDADTSIANNKRKATLEMIRKFIKSAGGNVGGNMNPKWHKPKG